MYLLNTLLSEQLHEGLFQRIKQSATHKITQSHTDAPNPSEF